jgi:hypothetical protein
LSKVSLEATAWKWLIVGHRWLGIGTCLFFAMWFATGLVMVYVGFPEHTTTERLALLEPIDWGQVRISPERVLQGRAEFPRDFRLQMMAGEPVYRIATTGSHRQTVSASTGRTIETVDAVTARAIVERAAGASVRAIATLDRDQWTVAGTFEGHRPLYRVALADEHGLELYVSSRTGEIVLDTTARERAWNWAGAVLHWLYFTKLRANPPLWSEVVKWISGVGIVVALTGLWLGIDRLRIRRRNGTRSITPFRGWMAWHHIAGVIGGLFVLTFIFSGWLSMGPRVPWERAFDPGRRTAAIAALAGNTAPEFPVPVTILQTVAMKDVREASFMWALGEPQIILTDGENQRRIIDGVSGGPRILDEGTMVAYASRLLSDAESSEVERLEREDAYWYSRRSERALPVLRFKFNDVDRTWLHIDPATGQLVGWLRQSDRVNRWLFNALHSFDFRWLLAHPPMWDVLIWVLSLAGFALSMTSIVIGWRAFRR